MITCVIIIIVFLLIFILSNIFITTTEITVKSEKLPEGFQGFKILHLSDLHLKKFGYNYKRLIDKINAEKFDVVVFTGDLISRTEVDTSGKLFLMKELLKKAPVYFIYGNHEVENPKTTEEMCNQLVKIGVRILDNQTIPIFKNGDTINISGLTIDKQFYKNIDKTYKNLPIPDLRYINYRIGGKSNFTVLLAHTPFPFNSYAQWGADLTLCGHVHGGVVRLPLVKGVLSPERRFFPKFSAGLYKKGNSQMIVNRGLGKPRLFNNSEIIIITLDRDKDK